MPEPLRGKKTEQDCGCYYFEFEDVKSAVDFYLKYRHCNFGLDELKHIMPEDVQTQYELYNTEYVDDWLFEYCFGDLIE